jgi:hypothetical protein
VSGKRLTWETAFNIAMAISLLGMVAVTATWVWNAFAG